MDKYYIDIEGRKYRVVCVARDINNKECVVCQALFGNGDYCVRSKEEFSNKTIPPMIPGKYFYHLDESVALQDVPIVLNPQYHFPDIEYSNKMDSVSSRRDGVKGMISLLEKYDDIKNRGLFKDGDNANTVEKRIIETIREYDGADESKLQNIFHLIQAWGGMMGRNIYVKGDGLIWDGVNGIKQYYNDLVAGCLKKYASSDELINELVSLVKVFDDHVHNLGISFITKHTYFWLQKNEDGIALPIYDSIMALEVMHRSDVKANDLGNYWRVMVAKANQLGIDIKSLERQIYIHARDNR